MPLLFPKVIFNKDCLAGHPVIVALGPVMVLNKYLLNELRSHLISGTPKIFFESIIEWL